MGAYFAMRAAERAKERETLVSSWDFIHKVKSSPIPYIDHSFSGFGIIGSNITGYSTGGLSYGDG